jgi:hypothetical protein
MIGVIASPSEHAVVSEFFELFKTPWEVSRPETHYDVLLCAGDRGSSGATADVVLVYAGCETAFDVQQNLHVHAQRTGGRVLSYRGGPPIYRESVTFDRGDLPAVRCAETSEAIVHVSRNARTTTVRIGYDLFAEVRELLTTGQPSIHAEVPTLDLHIALLRELIVGSGVPLVEIPPVPDGHQFVACLTHDVDHPSIRRHKLDHTTLGFLYRATVGTAVQLVTGRVHARHLVRNLAAALKLPFIHLGLAKDFWSDFELYIAMERGLPSTFFMIPFQGYAGVTRTGAAPRFRASGYAAADLAGAIERLRSAGCEIGLHGLDAWADKAAASREIAEIQRLTGGERPGVRMHWLFFDHASPETLDSAGAAYDSTVGYNDAVGYRAGTTQAYKPLRAASMLELPLHIMDTALFYPGRMHLTADEAWKRAAVCVQIAAEFGGTLTVNWHDRSIAPERLWDSFYAELLEELRGKDPWFATMRQAAAWFRKRRAAKFETVSFDGAEIRAKVLLPPEDDTPGLRLRIYQPQPKPEFEQAAPLAFSDFKLAVGETMTIDVNDSFVTAAPAAHCNLH